MRRTIAISAGTLVLAGALAGCAGQGGTGARPAAPGGAVDGTAA